MKNSFIILTLVIGFIFYPLIYPLCKTSLLNNTTVGCDSIPELNKQVIDFVKSKISKKVGRGECWDLASEALKSIDAHWDGRYKFGKEIFFQTECIFPDDIIQFTGARVVYKKDNMTYKEKMSRHTAIIYEVKGKGNYIIAHQNTYFSGRKVGLSPLDLGNVTKGQFNIYRPVK